MSEDEDTIEAGNGRPVQVRKPKPKDFTKTKQTTFLETLAETANVTRSAKAAGITNSCAYRKRQTDQEFRVGWSQALQHGFAALEAALLERARQAAGEFDLSQAEPPTVGTMDAKLAFALLQNHERNRDKAPGDGRRNRGDIDGVIERLEKALKRYAPNVAPDAEKGA